MTRISDSERRARLAARHHLGRTASDVVEAVRGVAALHSSDPLTPHLGLRARVAGFETADLDRALLEQRTLWRLHAMRRTLFVVPADDAGVYLSGASREVARRERRRIEGPIEAELEAIVGAERGSGSELDAQRDSAPRAVSAADWFRRVESEVLDALGGGAELRTSDFAEAVPALATRITMGSGKWTSRVPLSSRVLFLMAMEGLVVRTRPAGSWRSSQYAWAAAEQWFGSAPERPEPDEARAGILRRYLAGHGPATFTDLRWWTGWTVKRTKAALRACEARVVELEDGGEAFVLPDDAEPGGTGEGLSENGPTVALLPALDPTTMGWKERDWYLGEHGPALFDRNGNAGPTIWLGGRVVGGWAQRPDGTVAWRLLEDVGSDAEARVNGEAAPLEAWLGGTVVTPVFRTPLEKELAAESGR